MVIMMILDLKVTPMTAASKSSSYCWNRHEYKNNGRNHRPVVAAQEDKHGDILLPVFSRRLSQDTTLRSESVISISQTNDSNTLLLQFTFL